MKTNYLFLQNKQLRFSMAGILLAIFSFAIPSLKAQEGEGGRVLSCIYAIQESSKCFDPIAPETYVCDSARAFPMDFASCDCCPSNDAGTWSVISGPGNVIFSSLTEDSTEFCVDAPGSYLLRYSWPLPWNTYVQTEYYFYIPYSANISADDSCGLSTMVHFEYSSTFADPNTTLEWTLNGEPYSGPALNPGGDTIDFQLTVPYCGEWTLEASIGSTSCSPLVVSVTVNLYGNSGPVITGVGADTTFVCPDEPVFSDPTISDPCDPNPVITITTDSIPGDCPDSYTLIRTWTAVNDCGHISSDTQTVVHLPNPNPNIVTGYQTEEVGDTILAACDEQVTIPFPEIMTSCGMAETHYSRSDSADWYDPYLPGTTEVCYWGISPCGFSTDTLCITVIVEECEGEVEQFCSLTQGYYGNPGGYYCNGMGTAELIESLLEDEDLVVGSNGNTMTFTSGESGCIISLLPGGGPSKKITGANTCASHPGIQTKNGIIKNSLLAQTITLGLNLRLSTDLGALQMFSDTLMTAPSSGCDGEGDTITGGYNSRIIPQSVYNVLSQNGTIIPTVDDLFALANTALGGGAIGATTLSAISDAASKINEGFDECQFGYFVQPLYTQSMAASGSNSPILDVTSLDMQIYPNPFNTSTRIEFIAPESGHACVEIYTLTGSKIAVLYDGMVEAGTKYQYDFTGDPGMYQVTYLCVIRTDKETKYARMVMMR